MPEQNVPKRKFNWILAVAVIGIAAGCAIGSVVESFGREPFTIDAMDTTFRYGSGRHACELALGLSIQGSSIRSGAYRLATGFYRLIQSARFALSK